MASADSGFPHLFSGLRIGGAEIANRIVSTGHQTNLGANGLPSEDLVAYHEARARGGTGLIVVEAIRFHASSGSDARELHLLSDEAIPAYSALAGAVRRHGTRIFGQLSHSGRASRRLSGGMRDVVFGVSDMPDTRHHVVPRPMSIDMVSELVDAMGTAAVRLAEAGFDGVELVASHGLLLSQFLNPRVNCRTDRYGGSDENRLRFVSECLGAVRSRAPAGFVQGLRLSADEHEQEGLSAPEVLDICRALAATGDLDYLSVTMGSASSLGGAIHVAPPMEIRPGYAAASAAALREASRLPVVLAGRINDPRIAEQVLARGEADMCGMTRALIADADMPIKVSAGRVDAVRSCIACNQACIGHFQAGAAVSCIQDPTSGRELRLPAIRRVRSVATVLVAGGGPAGMKAAVTAARAGHKVALHESGPRLGGQVLLAQALPGREEFGGLVTNLRAELDDVGVEIRLNSSVTPPLVAAARPALLVVATGARPFSPRIGGDPGCILEASAAIDGSAKIGSRVLVADWRGDWMGLGVAEKLVRAGHHVRLAVSAPNAGWNLQSYLRDLWVTRLVRFGVAVIPYVTLFGMADRAAYLSNVISGDAVVCEDVDTILTAHAWQPDPLFDQEPPAGVRLVRVGDCLAPRTAEEAIYEGHLAALGIS